MSIRMEVWGDYACFTRPEMKVERVSYDVPTHSAARGMVESVYFHPGLVWRIDRIYVLSPITFTNLRRNEVKSKILSSSVRTAMTGGQAPLYIAASEDIQQRAAMMLRDVHYVIDAHFDMTVRASATDNPGKFQDIMRRRVEKGQFYHQPCLGVREFPAHFRPCIELPLCPEELKGEKDLGWMLLDLDYSDKENITPRFLRAILKDGVLEVPHMYSEEVRA